MITQPYTKLVLDGTTTEEVSSATSMDGVNAVQLTVTAVELVGVGDFEVSVEVSNDAQNWSLNGAKSRLSSPGFYVLPANTGICTRYVRVACNLLDDMIALLAVTQSTMRL